VATSPRRSGDRRSLGAFGDGLGEAFATRAFLGVGFGIGLGVGFGFGVGVAVDFGVETGVGVDDGNSISLLAVVTAGFFSCSSSSFDGFGASGLGGDDGSLSDSPAARPPGPNQTMLSGFDDARAARLKRMSPAISATCARAIRTTFRQKRPVFAIYFGSALVAMPSLVIPARCRAFISPINFCTGNSRSGRITMATSGFFCFNSLSCSVSVPKSTT